MSLPAKKKKRTATTVIGFAILTGVGFWQWHSGAQPANAGEKETHAEGVENVKLENVVVNLYDEDESHYLKCTIELEPASAKAAEFITQRMAVVRNDALLYLSSLTVADTPGEKLKVDIQNKLVTRANRALGSEMIKHAYFVEFVVQ